MSISLRIRILLIFGPRNPNTLKKLESEYIYTKIYTEYKIEGIREFKKAVPSALGLIISRHPYESIYGLESEYISFFAIEYEYDYP